MLITVPDMSWIISPQQTDLSATANWAKTKSPGTKFPVSCFLIFLGCVGVSSFGCLCCTVWAFSSCGKQGLVSSCCAWVSHSGGFSCCGAWAPGSLGSVALWHVGLVALWHVGSSQFRDQTYVSCIGRQILNHWITREVPQCLSLHHSDWL